MGAIHFRRIELVTSLNELVGYKAGVALERQKMQEIVDGNDDLFMGDDDAMLRVRSESYDELLCKLLYAVGNIRSPDSIPSHIQLYHQVKKDKQLYPVYLKVTQEWIQFLERAMAECLRRNEKTIDPRPLLKWSKKEHGLEGMAIALALLEGQNLDMHKSAFGGFRKIEWQDVADLKSLFESENIGTRHGEFFDQRFVDYLSHNFESIGKINWRKFEGLTCEFFHRIGLKVEIGKGRGDDSVDARVWAKGKSKKTPPLILVQCKRQKDAVEKVVVKALYADVVHAKAALGLVVTSSALSPGAKTVCSARCYPVAEANRETLKVWMEAMRTPYSGIFLGE